MSLKRRAMREEQRVKEAVKPEVLSQTKKSAEAAETFLKSMLGKYQTQYNDFLKTTANFTPAESMVFSISVDVTTALESELRRSLQQVPEELFQKAKRDPENSDAIEIMYLRVDKTTYLKEGHNIKKRGSSGAERLDGNVLEQLLYHAAVIITTNQDQELEETAAKHQLCNDFINHLVFAGIQHQEMNNEKQWSQEAKANTAELKTKMEEVTEIFNHAAEMKVAQD